MASQQTFVDYVADQLSALRNIHTLKMFGEYGLYYGNKIVILICDDKVFLKVTETGEKLIKGRFKLAPAYPGAKPSFLIGEDIIEDRELFCALVSTTADSLPEPKNKQPKHKPSKKTTIIQ
ncbi:MAG: hypothetical protein A2252_02480 [Elusimicrobia bacterium RIFOXYA2_FULL_39_19]|nr:MAG: hypothetical protein A2252_02480 [Elusimicrobia bacterium RIFOXYA2_FULL_39_19]